MSTDLLAISNVPTVIWVDEDNRVVRPNAPEFGTDTFAEFSGVRSGPHLDLVREWVRHGAVPQDASGQVDDLTPEELRARLHFRIGAHLRRRGEPGAEEHFAEAVRLAPLDFTIARAALPLIGGDPFGAEFFELYRRWSDAGHPYHGLSARREGGPESATNPE